MVQVTAGGQVTDNSGVSIASGSNATQTAGNVQGSAAEAAPLKTPNELAATPAPEAAPADGAPEVPADGAPAEDAPKERPEGVSPDAPEGFVPFAGTDDELKASLKTAGGLYADPRYETAAVEFERSGVISDATRDKLALEFGVERSIVDSVIEGQVSRRSEGHAQAQRTAEQAKAAQDAMIADVTSVVEGGADGYGKFIEWASKSLSPAQKDAYNKALDSDPSVAKELLRGYNESYKASGFGPGPRDIAEEASQGGDVGQAVQGFASQAEQQAAIRDPRYRKDAAYRKSVEGRIAKSNYG
jgi:hypothetical protein